MQAKRKAHWKKVHSSKNKINQFNTKKIIGMTEKDSIWSCVAGENAWND